MGLQITIPDSIIPRLQIFENFMGHGNAERLHQMIYVKKRGRQKRHD